MDYLLASLAIILALIGLLGCLLPVIPGPPISFAAILLMQATRLGELTKSTIFILGAVTITVTIMDYIIPAWTTKKFGGSKRGAIGATLGLAVGILLLPPIGAVIGPFIGAFIGEITGGATNIKATKAAIGSFAGFVLGTGVKIATSGFMLYMVIREVIT
ncbi:MAG TPA: DUF456 domain-containing protein [Williamwhitmania sp.]|nr:DUF456 domain-containing protein [Williamwhitmania sp.]